MDINQKNKALYEQAFIADPNSGFQIDEAKWKPSINEGEISEWSQNKEGESIPATPLGYRDYLTSRLEGLDNILKEEPDAEMTILELKGTVRGFEKFNMYDHLRLTYENGDENCSQTCCLDVAVCGYEGNGLLIVCDKENHLYSVDVAVTQEYAIYKDIVGYLSGILAQSNNTPADEIKYSKVKATLDAVLEQFAAYKARLIALGKSEEYA